MSTNNQILRLRLPATKVKLLAEAAAQNGLSTSSYLRSVVFKHVAVKLEPALKRAETEVEPA